MKLKIYACVLATILFAACSSDDKKPARSVDLGHAANFVVATDHDGYINVYALNHDGKNLNKFGDVVADKTPLFHFQVEKAGLPGELITSYGEMHYTEKHKKLIIVSNDATDLRDSALIIVDIKEAVELGTAGDAVAPAIRVLPMPSTQAFLADKTTAAPTRLVHGYIDHSGDFFWINNDGSSYSASNPFVFKDKNGVEHTVSAEDAAMADSTFRVDLAAAEPAVVEVGIGNGHKKGALMSQPAGTEVTTTLTNLPDLFASHAGGGAYFVISDNAEPGVVDCQTLPGENFHGIASSRVNGKIYAGSTVSSEDATRQTACAPECAIPNVGLAVYDTVAMAPAAPILNGRAAGEIPVAGYVKSSHDETRIYTFGWLSEFDINSQPNIGQGYLSVINASNTTVNDVPDSGVTAVVPLTNISASSIDVVDMDNGESKVYIPGAVRGCFNRGATTIADLAQAEQDVNANRVMVVHMDANGDPKAGTAVTEIPVGEAPCHRNGEVSHDQTLVVYPDGCRDWPVPDGFHCEVKTIKVITTANDTVSQELETNGHHPRTVTVVPAHDIVTGHVH